jgi:putative ABC transport system substrate-binding protein
LVSSRDGRRNGCDQEHSCRLPCGGAAVEQGLVAGLARPGRNLTGITFQANKTLASKYLELLKEMVPKLSLVAVLRVPAEDPAKDLTSALASVAKERPQALLGAPSGLLYVFRQDVVEFAAKHRLPAVYGLREVLEAGGLMSLSPNTLDFAIRGASYVDKILKGTKPADLPVEQPTKFEFVINPKTAKALGLTIPQSLLLRADQVIE